MSNCHVCFHYKGSPACVAVKATGEHCPAEPVTDAAIMTSAEKAAVVAKGPPIDRYDFFPPTTHAIARQALKGDKQS